MKTKAEQKIFKDLTATKLEEMTRDLDREFIADTFRPMTPREQERWERAKRKTKSGTAASNVKTIAVNVEKSLLERSENLAKKKGLTRDALIGRALKTVLAADGQDV